MEGYCLKCRLRREIGDPDQVTLKNGRPAVKGICGTCSTKMFKIGQKLA